MSEMENKNLHWKRNSNFPRKENKKTDGKLTEKRILEAVQEI